MATILGNIMGRPWTTTEILFLREHADLGAGELASRMGRSRYSVEHAASRFRVSLRRPGERRGNLLGQPRGVSLPQDMREDVVSGRVPQGLVAERLRIERDAELCPACAVRPVRVQSSGLCRVCHLHRLAESHREALAEVEAQRELWRTRQQLHRARQQTGRPA